MSEINFLNIIQVIVAVALIIFILIQRGPGATAGSAFGGGASGTVFGAKGSGSFLTKTTALLATAFFIITMLIAINASNQFASTGDAAEQDLGVIGTLDDLDAEPVMMPTDGTQGALDEAAAEAINSAGNVVEDAQQEVVDSAMGEVAEDATQSVEEAQQDAETSDTDGDGN